MLEMNNKYLQDAGIQHFKKICVFRIAASVLFDHPFFYPIYSQIATLKQSI